MNPRPLHLRAPLVYLLAPWVGGLLLAQVLPVEHPRLVLALSALPALGAFWWTWHRPAGNLFFAFWLSLGAGLTGWGYASWKSTFIQDFLRDRPPREAQLEIVVERLFALPPESRHLSGYGRIQAAPAYLPGAVGQRIAFSLRRENHRPLPGETLSVHGVVAPLPEEEEADGFREYLRLLGLRAELSRGRILQTVTSAPAWEKMLASARQRMSDILQSGRDRQPLLASIYTSMLLGEKSRLGDEQKQRYLRSGTMHLFAISGLHVMAIAGFLEVLLALCRLPRTWRAIVGLLLLTLYVFVTGAPPSAMRALLMVYAFWSSRWWSRQPSPFASWCLAALLVLVWDPSALQQAGFLLSYLVVAGILLYGVPLSEWAVRRWQPWALLPLADWRWWRKALDRGRIWITQGLAISLAATLASAPLVISFFGLFSTVAFILNLFLVPLSGLIVCTGMLSIGSGLLGLAPLVTLFNLSAWMQIAVLDGLIDTFLRLPGAWFTLPTAPSWLTVCWSFLQWGSFLLTAARQPHRQPVWVWWAPLVCFTAGLFALLTFSAA